MGEAITAVLNRIATDVKRLEADNQRLRAALEKILEANKMFQFAPRIQTTMWNIAREALNPEA